MTKTDFINRVLLIMNEAGMSDPNQPDVFIGADTAQIDRQIEGAYLDAWRRCVKVMPKHWFENKSFKNNSPTIDAQQGTGYVTLPDDFYLLTAFKMQGWQKEVTEATLENERVNSIQANEYTRGSAIRPVCTISVEQVGAEIKRVLNYYSLPKKQQSHTVAKAIYIPVAKAMIKMQDEEELELSQQVLEPMAYITASTVFTIHGKDTISKALDERAVEMFPGLQQMRFGVTTVKQ